MVRWDVAFDMLCCNFLTTNCPFVSLTGSAVFMPILCLFRNPDIFMNCDSFVPSRWEQPTEAMKQAYMPFAVGKRNCVGQSLAMSEMQCIASRLCSRYHFDVVEPGDFDFTLVFHPVKAKVKATRI